MLRFYKLTFIGKYLFLNMLSTDVSHDVNTNKKKENSSFFEEVKYKKFVSSCQINIVKRLDKKHLQIFNECSKKGV